MAASLTRFIAQIRELIMGKGTSAPASEKIRLKEWENARLAIDRFDQLLMTIRTFGLPVIATVVGGGVAIGQDQPRVHVVSEVTAAMAAGMGAVFLVCILLIWRRLLTRAGIRWFEHILMWGVVGSSFFWCVKLLDRDPSEFLLSGPVLVAGGLILFSVYLLDRFYYTGLVIGAVDRAKELERELGMELTERIGQAIPNVTYTMLPTVFYLIPVLILVNAGFAVFAYTEAGS
ncbi:MAG: hypothetical protein IIA90_03385 [Chloroflexi bacterium]|nr:hypothetical protein [Chloroflexota bacterium]